MSTKIIDFTSNNITKINSWIGNKNALLCFISIINFLFISFFYNLWFWWMKFIFISLSVCACFVDRNKAEKTQLSDETGVGKCFIDSPVFSDQQISHESNCGRAHSESSSGRFFDLPSLCLLYSFIDSTPFLKRLSASKETSGNISLRERKQTERQICFRPVGCSTSENKKSVEWVPPETNQLRENFPPNHLT